MGTRIIAVKEALEGSAGLTRRTAAAKHFRLLIKAAGSAGQSAPVQSSTPGGNGLSAYSGPGPTSDKRRHSAMFCAFVRFMAAVVPAAMLILSPAIVAAQSADPKAGEQQRPPAQAGEAAKDGSPKKIDEFMEAARVLGGPAANPECVWLGRRVVNLLWRDDLDTAFRHLDLYDRFGCPGGHVQATFRCVVRQGNIDPKAPESLNARVHACWINPSLQPQAASAPAVNPDKPDVPNK